MAFLSGGDWNRSAITRSQNLRPAESGSVSLPAFQPSAAVEAVETPAEPSTEWETNPGSGPIIDQDEPLDCPDEDPQASAYMSPF